MPLLLLLATCESAVGDARLRSERLAQGVERCSGRMHEPEGGMVTDA